MRGRLHKYADSGFPKALGDVPSEPRHGSEARGLGFWGQVGPFLPDKNTRCTHLLGAHLNHNEQHGRIFLSFLDIAILGLKRVVGVWELGGDSQKSCVHIAEWPPGEEGQQTREVLKSRSGETFQEGRFQPNTSMRFLTPHCVKAGRPSSEAYKRLKGHPSGRCPGKKNL